MSCKLRAIFVSPSAGGGSRYWGFFYSHMGYSHRSCRIMALICKRRRHESEQIIIVQAVARKPIVESVTDTLPAIDLSFMNITCPYCDTFIASGLTNVFHQ